MFTARGFLFLICSVQDVLLRDSKYVIDSLIFQDEFSTLDENTWTLEQYIPTSPDYEFVVYKKDRDVTFVENGTLCIKPKFIDNMQELKKKNLDLTDGCTRTDQAKCSQRLFLLHNPIVSGRLVSKFNISDNLGVMIHAQLPLGDWIYPEIYLEGENDRRILIAYSRGNAKLTGNDGTDLGGSLLFGGPVANHTEPYRSRYLRSLRQEELFSNRTHAYILVITTEFIDLYLGDIKYGRVSRAESGFANKEMFRLVIGVGVGGISDFPDDFKSGKWVKPWKNSKANQVKSFYLNKNQWLPTWDEENRQLKIRRVGIYNLREQSPSEE